MVTGPSREKHCYSLHYNAQSCTFFWLPNPPSELTRWNHSFHNRLVDHHKIQCIVVLFVIWRGRKLIWKRPPSGTCLYQHCAIHGLLLVHLHSHQMAGGTSQICTVNQMTRLLLPATALGLACQKSQTQPFILFLYHPAIPGVLQWEFP